MFDSTGARLATASRLGRNAAAGALRRWRNSRFRPTIRFEPDAPELLLAPHLDDAVLNCWSLLASGRSLEVVNVFAGVPEPGFVTRWDAICGARESAEMSRERRVEDAEALALAGRSPVNLDLLEVESRRGRPRLGLAAVHAAIAAVAPAASRVYATAGIGAHVDHATLAALGAALAEAGMPVELYAELPYGVVHGWPHWVTGGTPEPHRDVDAFWEGFLVGLPVAARDGRVVTLDDRQAAAKLAAMRAYRTQFRALDGGDVGVLSNPAIHRFEVFWALGRAAA